MNSTAPCEVVLAVHLPLLRIDGPGIAFAGGELWQMPFETFDVLTDGAFADRRASYEAVAPVFYRVAVRPELRDLMPGDSSGASWMLAEGFGLDLIARLCESTARQAWQALLLHAPHAALPHPRWSVGFAIAGDGCGFRSGTGVARVACHRGDADVDYLFTPDFVGTPLPREAIARAGQWAARLAEPASIDVDLRAPLQALADASSPLLDAADRSMLATLALEALLLPEGHGGLGRTLGRRLAVLLGGSTVDRRAVQDLARTLYDARSASLHGDSMPAEAAAAIQAFVAMRLLARAIRALDHRVGQGTVADVLRGLHGPASSRSVAPEMVPLPALPPRQPLCGGEVVRTSVAGTPLESRGDDYLMWAPLVGLRVLEPMLFDDAPASPSLRPLSGREWTLLEPTEAAPGLVGAPAQDVQAQVAALAITLSHLDVLEEPDGHAAIERLAHRRDLAVAALRLAGFDRFQDPALAGSTVVRGATLWWRPCVLRRSTGPHMQGDAGEHVALSASAHRSRIAAPWRLLVAYDASPRHADIEHCLSLLRRGFDHRFADAAACLALRFALVEALLGRCRPAAEPVQMEDLIDTLLGADHAAARWFSTQGRVARQALARGRAAEIADPAALDALNRIAIAALQRAITLWLDQPDGTRRPGTLLIETLSRESRASG